MRKNILLDKFRGNQAVVNGWLSIPSSFSAEAMAHQGWDSLTVDLQHGISEYQSAVTMFQAISTTNTVPLARVPWLEEGIIMRMLDAGAYGIICPMVNTAGDAERIALSESFLRNRARFPVPVSRKFPPPKRVRFPAKSAKFQKNGPSFRQKMPNSPQKGQVPYQNASGFPKKLPETFAQGKLQSSDADIVW